MSRRNRKKEKSILVMLLSAAMVLSSAILTIPTGFRSVFASETDSGTYCGYTEHVHDEDCFEVVLVCALEESEGTMGHTHGEDCCETVATLICGQEESDGHVHTDACYSESQWIRACGQEEHEEHFHTEECYETEQVLICGLVEAEPQSGHVHTDECYEKVLTCTLEEHEHTLACFSNPNADTEAEVEIESEDAAEPESEEAESEADAAEPESEETESEAEAEEPMEESVRMPADGIDIIQSFTHNCDKTSAASGDTISCTMDTMITVPQYTQFGGPEYVVDDRPWSSDDFTVTFHDILDRGLTFDPDTVTVTMSYDDGVYQETLNITEWSTSGNAYGNTLYTVNADCADNCCFEVSVDLTELYRTLDQEGNDLSDDFEWILPYTTFEVSYDVVLNSDADRNNGRAKPGEYGSTAYVSAYCTDQYYEPEYWDSTAEFTDESEPVTVAVDTYGLAFYLYDSGTWVQNDSDTTDWIPDDAVPLAGAEFELCDGFGGNVTDLLVTDESGCAYSHLTFADGAAIFFKETRVPEGYAAEDGILQFTIKAEPAEDEYWYRYAYGNENISAESGFDVMIYKYAAGSTTEDENPQEAGSYRAAAYGAVGRPLAGAEFILSRKDEAGSILYAAAEEAADSDGFTSYTITEWVENKDEAATIKSDKDGYIEIVNMEAGTYTLTETKAPDGFVLLDGPVVFKVEDDGTVKLAAENASVTVSDDGTVMRIINGAGVLFPETGGVGVLPFMMTGIIMAGGALSVLHRRRRLA